jgi:hypothetical protein
MEQEARPIAPGLKWRRRKRGPDVPVWIATERAIGAGYTPKTVKLAHLADNAPALVARCKRLQSEMLLWLDGKTSPIPAFDGTAGALICIYQTHPQSSYHELKPSSRHPYDVYARKLVAHIGARRIDAVTASDFRGWFKVWSDNGKHIAAGRMAVTVLKAALTFGKGERLAGCAELKSILDDIDFPSVKRRRHAPTAAQIVAAREAAHAAGSPRRALLYALQYETQLRQWDVLGQWVELSDKRPSTLIGYGQKWLGPTFARIDDNMILRVMHGKTEDTTEAAGTFDLRVCPMVMEELAQIAPADRHGPLIVNESTGLPYRHETFRDGWRDDATAAGIPKAVWNRDLRAAGNTEASKAGVGKEDRAKVGGHSERTNAAVYDRDMVEAHRRVMKARLGFRESGKN